MSEETLSLIVQKSFWGLPAGTETVTIKISNIELIEEPEGHHTPNAVHFYLADKKKPMSVSKKNFKEVALEIGNALPHLRNFAMPDGTEVLVNPGAVTGISHIRVASRLPVNGEMPQSIAKSDLAAVYFFSGYRHLVVEDGNSNLYSLEKSVPANYIRMDPHKHRPKLGVVSL
jgi:hypothetical protein